MGHESCGYCNTVPCECNPYDPSGDMLEKMHADDDALSQKDAERFSEEQRASALATVQAYLEKHPSPHAARDKTEEWDMDERNRRIKNRKRVAGRFEEAQNIMDGGCVQEGLPSGWPLPEMHDGSLPPPMLTPTPTLLSVKDTNPKDAVGVKKWRQYCTIPTTIIWELGVAMLEGARKYGRHNYRVAGVRASVYIDAAKGHIDQWWEGEDIDEESKLNHIIKAIASLAVLRDAMIQDKWVDDRPPKTDLDKLRADLQEAVDSIFERIPEAKDAYLEGDQYDA